jgi:hypothetical protein
MWCAIKPLCFLSNWVITLGNVFKVFTKTMAVSTLATKDLEKLICGAEMGMKTLYFGQISGQTVVDVKNLW